jgi:hypothetical protein
MKRSFSKLAAIGLIGLGMFECGWSVYEVFLP